MCGKVFRVASLLPVVPCYPATLLPAAVSCCCSLPVLLSVVLSCLSYCWCVWLSFLVYTVLWGFFLSSGLVWGYVCLACIGVVCGYCRYLGIPLLPVVAGTLLLLVAPCSVASCCYLVFPLPGISLPMYGFWCSGICLLACLWVLRFYCMSGYISLWYLWLSGSSLWIAGHTVLPCILACYMAVGSLFFFCGVCVHGLPVDWLFGVLRICSV